MLLSKGCVATISAFQPHHLLHYVFLAHDSKWGRIPKKGNHGQATIAAYVVKHLQKERSRRILAQEVMTAAVIVSSIQEDVSILESAHPTVLRCLV